MILIVSKCSIYHVKIPIFSSIFRGPQTPHTSTNFQEIFVNENACHILGTICEPFRIPKTYNINRFKKCASRETNSISLYVCEGFILFWASSEKEASHFYYSWFAQTYNISRFKKCASREKNVQQLLIFFILDFYR